MAKRGAFIIGVIKPSLWAAFAYHFFCGVTSDFLRCFVPKQKATFIVYDIYSGEIFGDNLFKCF